MTADWSPRFIVWTHVQQGFRTLSRTAPYLSNHRAAVSQVRSLVAALHLSQPLYGFITEGVDLMNVVATPPGHPEPLVVGLIRCERGLLDRLLP